MQVRWIVIVVLFVLSFVAVFTLCAESTSAVDRAAALLTRFAYGAIVAVGFWTVSILMRKWTGVPVHAGGESIEIQQKVNDNVTGRYRVIGRDRDTQFETVEFIQADSTSNAQFKVELKGVDVVSVERA